ncbi:enhancer of mRNA decapping [Arachnomyces sp. PD_36]|nr:enhancer of mRNA decapping [Arachnomyces sp. PD_36]
MASDFIGYSVLVTLKSPPNCQVQGVVADVSGQRLTLQDVTLLWSGQRLPTYHIDAPGIADLEVSQNQPQSQSQAPASYGTTTIRDVKDGGYTQAYQNPQQEFQFPARQPAEINPPVPQPAPQPFVDPAILSFKKPSSVPAVEPDTTPTASEFKTLSPVMLPDTTKAAAHQVTPSFPEPVSSSVQTQTGGRGTSTAATLTEPFSNIDIGGRDGLAGKDDTIEDQVIEGTVPEGRKGAAPLDAPLKYTGKRSRRGGRGKAQKDAGSQTGSGVPAEDQDLTPTLPKKTNPKGKGWRQTAFVEPAQSTRDSPRSNGKGRRNRGNKGYAEDPNGWATEDATDIQEMGDFDFATNLSKFDKRRVFDEIRNDDTTADEERLVSFNRTVPRPGTNGGKNLHYTENVLDNTPPLNAWNSEAGETDEDDTTDGRFSSGKNSGRARSRTSAQKQSSRKGSAILNQTHVSAQINAISRGQLGSSRKASPRPNRQGVSSSPMNGPTGSVSASLRVATTNRNCPCVSPLQMLEIEQLAAAELGLTEDMITENAGRGIAESAITLASGLSSSPMVLVLAGNHRTGSRAISAARHFRNRGHRVTLCILGIERDNELLENVRRQVDIFMKVGGRVLRWGELSTRLAASDLVPELVVDALFGMHIAFEDLRTDDQATAFEMITWTNRSNIDVLSVDIPSGISASSGESTFVDGVRLSVTSKYVTCLGAPKLGTMNALLSGEGLSWQLTVADIGISQVVWRKYGTRRRHGVDFGNRWVAPLVFQASTPSVA